MPAGAPGPSGHAGRLTAALLAAALLAIVAWWPALDGPFYLDSRNAVAENPAVRVTALEPWQLRDAAGSSPHHGRIVQRWLPQLTFGLNHWLHGLDPAGYRLTNLALHLANGLLVFLLLRRLFDTPALLRLPPQRLTRAAAIASAAAALWLLNPLQTSAVSYVWSCTTLLATLFYLLAVLAYLQARLGRPGLARLAWWCLVPAAWLLALSSKEIAATLPAMLLLLEWFFVRDLRLPSPRGRLLLGMGVAATGIALVVLFLGDNPLDAVLRGYRRRDFSLAERVMTEWRVICDYLGLFLLPLPSRLTLEHQPSLSQGLLAPPATLLSLIMILGALGAAARLARRHRLAAFAILWFFLHLAIESSVIPLELMFEHRAYLPSIGIALLLALAFSAVPSRGVATGLILVLALLWGAWTWQRNQLWADPLAFWQAAVETAPASERAWLHLGRLYLESERPAAARDAFDRGIALLEQRHRLGPLSRARLASFLAARSRTHRGANAAARSEADLSQAIALGSKLTDGARLELAALYLAGERPDAALRVTDALLASDPTWPKTLALRGAALLALGRAADAVAALDAALRRGAAPAAWYNARGTAHARLGHRDAAEADFVTALRRDPGYSEAKENLGRLRRELTAQPAVRPGGQGTLPTN